MIFRRVVGNLRRQDWTAVVVELVVVIAGVFIGLQPPNWNENLRTDEKSADFTQRLRAGLREEAWAYEYEIAYSDEVIANAKRTADALSGAVPSSDEALPVTAYRATQYIFNASRRATYDELTSTGEIGLIRDPTLRDLAMRLYTMPIFNRIFDEGENNPYRKAFRMAIPYEVQESSPRTAATASCRPATTRVPELAGLSVLAEAAAGGRRGQRSSPPPRSAVSSTRAPSHRRRRHESGQSEDLLPGRPRRAAGARAVDAVAETKIAPSGAIRGV